MAGRLSISIKRRPLETAWRMPASSLVAACAEIVGSEAVAIEMPNRPIGMYIRRKA